MFIIKKNYDDLEHLLKCRVFDIVAVRETRITRKTSLTSNIICKIILLNSHQLNQMQGELSYT